MGVPLPDNPTVRIRIKHSNDSTLTAGSRIYLNYSGSAPSGANCTTLAGDVESAWASHLAGLINTNYALEEVDVLDIATDMGLSGQWSGSTAATRSGNQESSQEATNVEFGIATRYRGGKPRIFLPPPVDTDRENDSNWNSTFIGEVNAGVAAFFSELEGLSIGSMGTLSHVCLSYYKGYAKTSPPWRGPGFKYPPAYRATALSLPVTGYFCKAEIGSQRRRRTSTS